MKMIVVVAGVLVLGMWFAAAPAQAGDGDVALKSLHALGLAGMQPVSDAEGMKVRGMKLDAAVPGLAVARSRVVAIFQPVDPCHCNLPALQAIIHSPVLGVLGGEL